MKPHGSTQHLDSPSKFQFDRKKWEKLSLVDLCHFFSKIQNSDQIIHPSIYMMAVLKGKSDEDLKKSGSHPW
jgi:hypothetical protein